MADPKNQALAIYVFITPVTTRNTTSGPLCTPRLKHILNVREGITSAIKATRKVRFRC